MTPYTPFPALCLINPLWSLPGAFFPRKNPTGLPFLVVEPRAFTTSVCVRPDALQMGWQMGMEQVEGPLTRLCSVMDTFPPLRLYPGLSSNSIVIFSSLGCCICTQLFPSKNGSQVVFSGPRLLYFIVVFVNLRIPSLGSAKGAHLSH